ncbi:MAG: hypothetical protein HKN91_07990 [Acidimicrobiia bacterium]|nr:hypothetical protein [Acidimicrobiia bacterium]
MKPNGTDSSSAQLSQWVHDLRTPLGTMVTAFRIIEREVADDPKLSETVALGLRGGHKMRETIDLLHAGMEELLERDS